MTSRYAFRIVTHSPNSIAQRGIRVGWVGETELTRGLGPLSQHLIQQWLQVFGIRITCVCKLCTPPALKHDTSIQTPHNAHLPTPFLSFFPFTLRGGLTQRGGSYVRRVPLGVDPWKYQVATCACSAGPDLGPLSSHRSSSLLPPLPLVQRERQLDVSYAMAARLPCANHGHVGTPSPIFTEKPFAVAHGSPVSILLAPPLQFESLSTYSNQARAPSATSRRWMVAAPASSIGCPLKPFTSPDNAAELSSNRNCGISL